MADKTVISTPLPHDVRLSTYTAVAEFDHAARNGLTANYDVIHAMSVDRLSTFEITMVTRPDVAGSRVETSTPK